MSSVILCRIKEPLGAKTNRRSDGFWRERAVLKKALNRSGVGSINSDGRGAAIESRPEHRSFSLINIMEGVS